ncbi:MAG: GAF domain-containing protein [Rhodocyclaceae bacterium]|nr:GAF domain-containing protein [Rhodocyclaceae bacterium]
MPHEDEGASFRYSIYESERPARVGFQQLWKAMTAVVQLDGGWIWVQDADFRFVDITYGGPCRPRMSARSATGRRRWDLPLEGVTPEALAAHQAACERHEPFSCFEYRIRDEDDRLRWISVSGTPYFDEHGGFLGYMGIGRDVSAHHALHEEVWNWEQRMRSFAEYSPGWFWEQDTQFRFVRFWGQSLEKSQSPYSQPIGLTRWEMGLQGLSPEQMAAHRATLERHAAFHDFQYMLKNGDGGEEWYSISGRPTYDQHGAFAGYRGAGTRITPQRTMQAEVARYQQVLAAVNAMAEGLNATRRLEDVLQDIVERAQSLTGTTSGFVYLAGANADAMRLVLALGDIRDFLGTRLQPGEGVSGIVWQTGRPLLVNDYPRWPWRSRQFHNSGIRAIAGVPLSVGGQVLGVLGVAQTEPERRFEAQVLTGLEAFAPLAALAIQHSQDLPPTNGDAP